ncbi:MAG: class I SAM-dependent methyltransferase [Chloroflexi bacterium]|nr:class I SAM-dependent methyltransferase [Chloroflexota bacterium]
MVKSDSLQLDWIKMLSLEKQNNYRELYRKQNSDWQPGTELFAKLIKDHIQPTSRILDIGCGRGGLVEQLNHPTSQMVGIDPDWMSLAEHRLGIPRVVGISDFLPFAPRSFDIVFASWVLEHLERPLLTFQSIARILKPGGIFVFITPNGRHPLSQINNMLGRFSRLQGTLVERFYGRPDDDTFPTFYRANTNKQLHRLTMESRLPIQALHPVADPTYLAFNNTLFHVMCQLEKLIPTRNKLHLVCVLQREHA